MKKRIVVGACILSSVCLHVIASETRETLKSAQQQQADKEYIKPSQRIKELANLPTKFTLEAIDLITVKNSPAQKTLTRNSQILATLVTGFFTCVGSVSSWALKNTAQETFKERPVYGTLCAAGSLGAAGITAITGIITLLFVRKTITGPSIDE